MHFTFYLKRLPITHRHCQLYLILYFSGLNVLAHSILEQVTEYSVSFFICLIKNRFGSRIDFEPKLDSKNRNGSESCDSQRFTALVHIKHV